MPLMPITFPSEPSWEKRLPVRSVVNRDQTILSLCANARVLHLGAADSPFSAGSAAEGKLLHQQVQRVAARVIGVDLDEAAVKYLRDVYGLTDILHADATALPDDASLHTAFDVILACDIIEHVPNIGMLIKSCLGHMSSETKLVISTINGTALKSALRALVGREAVHPDHIAYFSYGTLCQLLKRFGIEPLWAGYFQYPTMTRFADLAFRIAARVSPACSDGILLVGQKSAT